MSTNNIGRYNELFAFIEKCNHAYHTLNTPIITDAEYDDIYREFKILEKELGISNPNSPTSTVGSEPDTSSTVNHVTRMYSLDNVFSQTELMEFFHKAYAQTDITIDRKIDGCALEIQYDGLGKFLALVSRGNGNKGQRVSKLINIMTHPGLLLELPIKYAGKIKALYGELVLSKYGFNKFKEDPLGKDYSNARNLVGGLMQVQDLTPFMGKLHLEFILYGYHGKQALDMDTLRDISAEMNLYVPEFYDTQLHLSEKYITEMRLTKESYPYETDGCVVKLRDSKLIAKLGYTSHAPKFQVAYKFNEEIVKTKLLDIIYSMGRTSVLTPVAILEPVVINNVKVSRATFHNVKAILNMGCCVDDNVLIKRSGEVIPYIVSIVKEDRAPDALEFEIPTECPFCNGPVSMGTNDPESPKLYCLNPECFEMKVAKFVYFAQTIDVDHFGPGRISTILTKYPDLTFNRFIKLTQSELTDMFGELIGNTMYNALSKTMSEVPDHLVLAGLGITHVGKRASSSILKYCKTIQNAVLLTVDELQRVPSIGKEISGIFVDYFANTDRKESVLSLFDDIKQLRDNDEYITSIEVPNKGTVLFTGCHENMTRKELESIARQAGYEITSGVTNNLNLLVKGSAPSQIKLRKAEKLNTRIISADEFLNNLK